MLMLEAGVVVVYLPSEPLKPAVGWSRCQDVKPLRTVLASDIASKPPSVISLGTAALYSNVMCLLIN